MEKKLHILWVLQRLITNGDKNIDYLALHIYSLQELRFSQMVFFILLPVGAPKQLGRDITNGNISKKMNTLFNILETALPLSMHGLKLLVKFKEFGHRIIGLKYFSL